MKKNILIAIESFHIGGAERQAFNLAKGLKEKGYTVTMAAFNEQGPLKEECKLNQIPTFKLPGNFNANSFKFQQRKIKLTIPLFQLWLKLIKCHFDLIIPYTAPCNVSINYITKYLPNTISYWNQRDEGRGLATDKYWIINEALENSHHMISNSTQGAQFITSIDSKYKNKIKLIYNGIEPAKPLKTKEEWLNELSLPADATLGIMIANIHSAKDHETALKAWKMVVDRSADHKPILIFAGHYDKNDKYYNKINKLAFDLKIQDHIHFAGQVSDISGLIKVADICVFSSHREGLPNAILEPMYFGLPIAATELPGVVEALGNDYKYISPYQNAELLAENILILMNDKAAYRFASERNISRIRSLFSTEQMISSYINLIQSS